jgi:hypothetical protein
LLRDGGSGVWDSNGDVQDAIAIEIAENHRVRARS